MRATSLEQGCYKTGILNFPDLSPTEIAYFPEIQQSLPNHEWGGALWMVFLKTLRLEEIHRNTYFGRYLSPICTFDIRYLIRNA